MTITAMRSTEEASQVAISELIGALESEYGAALRTVVRFGSAVAGEVLPGQTDTNLLVITDALPLRSLLRDAVAFQKWTAAGNPAPLILTREEWQSSADIFAMEYADILHRHEVLFGEAPFGDVTVALSDLRISVERETMGKLLQLRRAVMAVGGDGPSQLRLLVNGLSTLMVLFRGVLRVAGQPPATNYVELSRATAALVGFDAAPFERLVQHARREVQIPPSDATALLTSVLETMGRLVAHLDRAGKPSAR